MTAEIRHLPDRDVRRLWRFVTVIEQERGANDHEWLHREAFQLKPLLEAALLAAPAVPLTAYWMKDGKMYPTTVEDWLAKTESFHVQSSFAAWVICEARRLIDALTKGAAPAVPQDEQDRAELARIPESYETPVDHYREMARRFAESRDELKHRCRTLETRIKELEVAAPAVPASQQEETPKPQAIDTE